MTTRRTLPAIALAAAVAAGIFFFLRSDISRSGDDPPIDAATAREVRRRSLDPIRASFFTPDLLRRPKTTLFGLHDAAFPAEMSTLYAVEKQLGVAFSIVSFNVAWGDDRSFPQSALDRINESGSVAMITWAPQVTNFTSTPVNQLPPRGEREYRSLESIARGAYDFYIVEWAATAARYRKPLFIRFAPEMNDPYRHSWGPQNGNRPEDFIAAWRHLWRVFQRSNATNVVWVWSPEIGVPHFEQYYPGSDVVDWTGASTLNYGTTRAWSRWWELPDIFEKAYLILKSMQKPIMLTEFGSVDRGGDPAVWYAEAFRLLRNRFDQVRAVILLHRRELPPRLTWSVAAHARVAEAVAEEMLRNGVRPLPED